MNTVLPFWYHHFWSAPFRIWVHSFRGKCEHMYSRSSRLTVKGSNQSEIPCVGSSLYIFSYAGSGIDDSSGTTRSTKLSIVQVIDFPLLANRRVSSIFYSNEYPCFEQRKWSNRTAGVSPSSRTVTNRPKSWTKLVRPRLCALFYSRSVPSYGFWIFSAKYPFYLSLNLPRSALCICLSWGFLRCSFLKTERARISLMRFAFLDNSFRLPFSFPNFDSYQMHPKNFMVCPAEAFNPNSSTFRGIKFVGSESWDTQPWTFFFFSQSHLLLEYLLLFELALRFPFTVSMSK